MPPVITMPVALLTFFRDQTLVLGLGLAVFGGAQLGAAPPTPGEAKQHFERADGALNTAWAEAKRRFSPERMKELTGLQREWVGYRDMRADQATQKAGAASQPATMKSPAWYETAARLSQDRASWLQRLIKFEGEPVTGVWIDGKGGTLDVVEKEGRLYFDLNTVRGPGFDLGVIAGTASWNPPLGWFSDKGKVPDKNDESNLVFILKDVYLELVSANAESYHGKRAYLDGLYFKVASLDEAEQAEVLKAGQAGRSRAVPD